jgi:Flp pilus assembly pilin Flp
MLKDTRGLSMVEYILGGSLALAIIGLAVYGIAGSVSDQGSNVEGAVDDMPDQPSWGS